MILPFMEQQVTYDAWDQEIWGVWKAAMPT